MSLILGIETSCDETSAAVVCGGKILSNVVSSQVLLHAEFGGVVPEIASRQHLRLIDSVLSQAIEKAGVNIRDLDAVAVTRGPGLPSALLVGVAAARGVAYRWGKPLVPVHHMEAHLYSAPVPVGESQVALVVSGGHTMLVHVKRAGDHRVLGQTVDDAAGEAFDKVSQLLGLGYPGGPRIEKAARQGDAGKYEFPRPMLDSGDWNFSFSGLKTAVRRTVAGLQPLTEKTVADLCAGFQLAVVDVLVKKTVKAAQSLKARQVSMSGGVCCNQFLKDRMEQACRKEGITTFFAERSLCTDNAGMIALLAEKKLEGGVVPQEWDVEPDWKLG